uniref:Uncharacterized protein n=1 Tax=Panthera tigris altaica TaxID=74533 RepID=A0A8C9JHS5_PANTA
MADDLKQFLCETLPSVEGLYALVGSDRDAVPVTKVASDGAPGGSVDLSFCTSIRALCS